MTPRLVAASFGLIAALAAQTAHAADVVLYGGVELEYLIDPAGDGSGDTPSVEGYLEAEFGSIYAGVGVERPDSAADTELYLYAGTRGETQGGLTYDIVYTHYSYPNLSGGDYGELGLSLGTSLGERASVTGTVYYYPESSLASAYVEGTLTLADRLEGSVNFGIYEVAGAASESEWDIGATYALSDEAGLDLRYYDGSEYVDSYLGLSFALDTTLFGG